ncbi:type II toxin-antitoxin system RelE/ParE family toxin [Palleronia caenipelagi]|uniref:Type II toxin-antitoxin system RelE/ParE family toxin n=1 Tax=Palleronia caenipelagi TaxID=2489174 RepID=A0A547PM46_9RHOB|nr:type II toxin-antitoxin system RelE/ParE family toxin [Palleronia caenipelagi]
MAWTIEITAEAAKQIKKLGGADAKRIRDYLRDRIASLEDPRQLGKPLKGSELGHLWRYRVGDWRVLCSLEDDRLVVLVVALGHRRNVYR